MLCKFTERILDNKSMKHCHRLDKIDVIYLSIFKPVNKKLKEMNKHFDKLLDVLPILMLIKYFLIKLVCAL